MNIAALDLKNEFESSYCNEYGDPLKYLPNVKHINVLVGENNSGKSRFCRQMINSGSITILSDNETSNNQVSTSRRQLKVALNGLKDKVPGITISPLHDDMTATELFVYYQNLYDHLNLKTMNLTYPWNNNLTHYSEELKRLSNIVTLKDPRNQMGMYLNKINTIYMPVLRGIESFNIYYNLRDSQQLDSLNMNAAQRKAMDDYKSNASRIYKNKTCKAYGLPESIVFTGENLYSEIRDKLLGQEEDRMLIRNFERFISKYFFDSEGFTIIPIIKAGYLNVKIGNNKERPLHDLGDGIKQLICILYKIYECKDIDSVIFIEEPELNLHPGYQRRLLNILQLAEFSKITFFITTHSNHIVDSCFDYSNIALYKFKSIDSKNGLFQVLNTSPSDIDILNQLGVTNSSVFMANSTIWVEGISDKIYLSTYLRVYMEANKLHFYKEGVDYSFVEYGGNNVTHWSFADDKDIGMIKASGVTNRALMIVDNDNGSKKKRKEKLKAIFEDDFIELPVREIENTIGNKLLEKTLFVESPVFKEGMQANRASIETQSTYVWDFIDKHYVLKRKYWNPQHKSPTISKSKFAKDVCANIEGIDDLSESAIQLCDKIYSFLSKVSSSINMCQ